MQVAPPVSSPHRRPAGPTSPPLAAGGASAQPLWPSPEVPSWRTWLAGKVEQACAFRALQMRGGLPPPQSPHAGPTVVEVVGWLAVAAGGSTLHAATRVPPPPPDFLA